MSVITISRQLGSLGTEIAQTVSERLDYEYVDKEKIGEALAAYDLPLSEVEKFDEKKPPFWGSWQTQREKFLHLLRAVIYDFASKGNVVIVGRGGQVLLKDLPGVLHLRIVAPFEVRIRGIIEQEGGDEKKAAQLLRRSDRDSAGFIRSFFDVDSEDPNLYDLVINTQKLSIDTAVEMILKVMQSPETKDGEEKAAEKLADLALIQKVEAALLSVVGGDLRHISIRIEDGVVTLGGTVTSGVGQESCQRAVAGINGVKRVENQLSVIQYYRPGT
ncbi:MAG: BON domain-containing protein [Deltaproteobacteria bacterium]|nr:BON domain-containing protein [Deltaproteobacteria bacterium]